MPETGYQPGPPPEPQRPGPPRKPRPPQPARPCQPPPPPHRACAVLDDAIAVAAMHTAAIKAVTIFLITPPRLRCTVQLRRIDPDQCGGPMRVSRCRRSAC